MKLYKTVFFISLGLSLLISGCGNGGSSDKETSSDSSNVTGNISLSGAFALYPLANIWAEEFRKVYPDVKFNISAGGAGKGMTDALSGAVDLGMFSREIKEEEKQKGVWWLSVTKDAVLPTINANNPELPILRERGLSQEEFNKIFITGELTLKIHRTCSTA